MVLWDGKLMQNNRVRSQIKRLSVVAAFLFAALIPSLAFANASTSPSYQVVETEFNAGTLEGCSGQYCARASIGDLMTSGATNGAATFSNTVGTDPLLEVIVEPGVSSVGTLAPDKTTSKTAMIKVRNYLSGGYVIQLKGEPPKFGTHVLDALSTPTAATPGTEQFGINLVANTTPSVGADPVQIPADQGQFGTVDSGYGTANLFKYVSEEVIARSTTDWGQTHYTLSMIVNVSNLTPAGHYSGDFAVIVTPFY